ncbi:CocE/NonD family hydrolase [Streptacidiphilus sp. EB129]|uniref:CocE/NonD family hydrolase n=1 Tax=Streptacidiphilus sp. EB129 TaxID=3156262 RepID=UPI003511CB72
MSHVIADAKWALTRLHMAVGKHLVLPFKELPSATPERFPKARALRGAMVAMRDGVELFTDVYLPADRTGAPIAAAAPAMLIRVPYGTREAYTYMPAVGRYWARRGYACVVQDVRGRFGSQGTWVPFAHEADDGYDTIDWVAGQRWCDGRVAMTGESYFAFTQWAAAAAQHPALTCIAPGDMGLDLHTLLYEGGALCLGSTALWACDQAGSGYLNWHRFDSEHLPVRDMAQAAGLPSALYRDAVDHPARDAFWQETDFRHLLDTIEVPAMVWGGWYDNLLPATLQTWDALEQRRPEPDRRADRRLVLGPTDHETSCDFDGTVGRIPVPAQPRSWDRVLEFTDAVLDGQELGPRVRAYITGADRWHHSDSWPPPEARTHRLYLHADRTLSTETPAAGKPGQLSGSGDGQAAEFTYDPADPVRSWQGKDLWAITRHLDDRRPLHQRPDILLYRTAPLGAPIEVLGQVTARLSVRTSAPDTDFTVALIDIAADGHAQLVQEGILRLSHRDPAHAPQNAEPGELYAIDVEVGATGHHFAPGHRIGIEISSSAFDRWDRNPNTGHPQGTGTTWQTARQTLHHHDAAPSRIDLPVIGEQP